jgi:hypothetical protein
MRCRRKTKLPSAAGWQINSIVTLGASLLGLRWSSGGDDFSERASLSIAGTFSESQRFRAIIGNPIFSDINNPACVAAAFELLASLTSFGCYARELCDDPPALRTFLTMGRNLFRFKFYNWDFLWLKTRA